jgi:site-specific recombinase XerD
VDVWRLKEIANSDSPTPKTLQVFRHLLRHNSRLTHLRQHRVEFASLNGRDWRLQREQAPKSAFVFTSERGAPFSTAEFARMIERAGREAKLAIKAHPHMLRHACGYALANKGHDIRALQAYLGHRNIQHTVRYTELSPTRFKDFWRD